MVIVVVNNRQYDTTPDRQFTLTLALTLTLIQFIEFEVKPGDVIITATDGLFDNIYPKDLGLVTKQEMQINQPPKDVATYIANVAQQLAANEEYLSPFAAAAFEAGYSFLGGKMDDITVIVSVVEPRGSYSEGAKGVEGGMAGGSMNEGG